MATKHEHVSTVNGFKVKKNGVETQVADVVVKDLTAAQIIAMYAAPIEVVPAVSGKAIFVESVEFDITRTSTQFTGGGVVNLQLANTANGAGTKVHADIAASVVTGTAGIVRYRCCLY